MRKCAYAYLRVRFRICANAHLRKFDTHVYQKISKSEKLAPRALKMRWCLFCNLVRRGSPKNERESTIYLGSYHRYYTAHTTTT